MRKKDDDYYGSEEHFRDIQDAARKTGYIEHPETLDDCRQNFRLALGELSRALGLDRLSDKILIAIGKLLLKLGWKNGN